MKTLLILLLTLTSIITVDTFQDERTIKATFDWYDDGTYYFTDAEEESYEFQKIDSIASKKYNLMDDKFNGKKFEVKYVIESDLDADDEEYTFYSILDLKLIN